MFWVFKNVSQEGCVINSSLVIRFLLTGKMDRWWVLKICSYLVNMIIGETSLPVTCVESDIMGLGFVAKGKL